MYRILDIASPFKINDVNKFTTEPIVVDCFDKILISYIKDDNTKGCMNCLSKRFILTRKDRLFIKEINFNRNYQNLNLFQELIDELLSVLKNSDDLIDQFGRRKFYILDKNDLSISSDYFNPVPDCPYCSSLPDDTEELICCSGSKVLQSIYSKQVVPFRSTDKSTLRDKLENLILSKNAGIVSILMDSLDGPFPIAVAMLPLETGRDEPGSGRTNKIEDSRAIALLEAIERYAGFRPRGKKTKIYDSYRNLQNTNQELIDLDKIILHENSLSYNSQYKNDIYKFDRMKKYHWVYGFNLSQNKPVLLPETLSYYGLKIKDKSYENEIFVYEISNGCSVGATLLESSYYGLLEIIERDAFLTAWYTSRSIKKIVLDDDFMHSDHKLKYEIYKFCEFYSEFKLDIYDITGDINIPTVLMTITRKSIDENKFNFMCSAASDFDIYKAVEKALHEISGIFMGFQEKFEKDYSIIKAKAENLVLVDDMLDHSLVYGFYKSIDKIIFEKQVTNVCDISSYRKSGENGLNYCYKKLLNELMKIDKEVIIVDQTTEEMAKINICCSKTIVPGLLPMTFGAKNARISKERIRELEKYEGSKLKLRLVPHPFP